MTVQLLDSVGNVLATTTTDANGAYLFPNLGPGTYKVKFTPSSDYYFSPQNVASDDTIDSDADETSGVTGDITIVSGVAQIQWDAGMIKYGCISGYKLDYCLKKKGKPAGLSGWIIYIDEPPYNGQRDPNERYVTSSADPTKLGYYEFCGLKPGSYRIREELKPVWETHLPASIDVDLLCGADKTNQNFENLAFHSISGHKYEFDGITNKKPVPIGT